MMTNSSDLKPGFPNQLLIQHSSPNQTQLNQLGYSNGTNDLVVAVYTYSYNSIGTFNISINANQSGVAMANIFSKLYTVKDGKDFRYIYEQYSII